MKNNAVAELQKTDPSSAESVCDDEINLVDYFLVLWKRKLFIFLATALPTLCLAGILLIGPKNYTTSYTYDVRIPTKENSKTDAAEWPIDKKNYDILLNEFYSDGNTAKLCEKLKKEGFEELAARFAKTFTPQQHVKIEAMPKFIDDDKSNGLDADKLAKIWDMRASLLKLTVQHDNPKEIDKVSKVVRHNFEQVMSLYPTLRQLTETINSYNKMIGDIEKTRFDLELSLKNNNDILAGLKRVSSDDTAGQKGDITLQFDVGNQDQYLPLSYQIQAAESKRIELEETIKLNNEKYNYYKDLVDLNNKALLELNTKLSSDYTTAQFLGFLTGLLGSTEKPQLKDYLSSYVRTIENAAATCRPVTEKPAIVSVDRGTAKKTGVVLAACLMLSIFAAFLMEGIEQNKARTLRA